MNINQVKMITNHVIRDKIKAKATVAVICDNITVYSAETEFGVVRGTLRRSVNRVRAEMEHFEKVLAAADK